MRVVGGELGGRRLHAPPGSAVRPTADRVREALFSILGEVSDARVLDLFCGTGALGIEALSRGAASATFVDTHPGAARRNLANLNLSSRAEPGGEADRRSRGTLEHHDVAEVRARLVRADALNFLRRAPRAAFDLVLCDPPYRLANRIGSELDPLISRCLARGGRAAVESSARDPLRLSLPLLRERRYGDTLILVYRR